MEPSPPRKFPYLTFVIGIFLAIFLLRLLSGPKLPPPLTLTYQLQAGHVARALITEQESPSEGRNVYFSPHHLNYVSSAGDIEIYVFSFSTTDDAEQVATMLQLSDDLEAGHPLKGFVGKTTGQQGRVPFPKDEWTPGQKRFLVLMRSPVDSEVSLVVYYGPENG